MKNTHQRILSLFADLVDVESMDKITSQVVSELNSLSSANRFRFEVSGHADSVQVFQVYSVMQFYGFLIVDPPLEKEESDLFDLTVQCVKILSALLERRSSAALIKQDHRELKQIFNTQTASLRQSEERYRLLFNSSEILVSLYDTNGKCLLMNEKVAALFGGKPADFIDRGFQELHPENATKYSRRIKEVIESETACEYIEEVAFNGNKRWLLSTVNPVRNSDGIVYAAQIMSQDITAQKLAEEQLRRKNQFIESIVNMSPNILYIYDIQEQKSIYSNDGLERVLGYLFEEISAMEDRLIQTLMHPEDYRNYLGMTFPKYNQLKDGEHIEHSYRMKSKSGEWRWLRSIESVFLRSEDKKVKQIFGVIIDITDQVIAEAQRETLQSQLWQSQKMEAIGRLAGGVAHDFNNMLSVIMGNTELVIDELGEDSAVYTELKEILNASQRSGELTRGLLGYARKQTALPITLDLNVTLREMQGILQRLIREDIAFEWNTGENIGLIRLDPAQLNQIVVNLFINAQDAMGSQGKIVISTSSADIDQEYCDANPQMVPGIYAVLEVQDTGCGIAPELLQKIFEPFFTTKPVGQGTGLGLSTVYGIVKQNNGFIQVESEEGIGSHFRLFFPVEESLTKETVNPITQFHEETGRTTVLLVEDERSILNLCRRLVEKLGYRVFTAETPSEALSIARQSDDPIDLLISDVVLPEMNGRDLASELSKICPEIRSLFMSGYTADVIAHRGVDDDSIHFIQKPFTRKEFYKQIGLILTGGCQEVS